MRARSIALVGLVLVAGVAVSRTAVDVSGQAARSHAPRAVPRLPDGHPDLQGTYDVGTLTPVERQAGTPLVLSEDQAKKLEDAEARRNAAADAPIQGDRPAPPLGGDGSIGAAGNVGGYNNFWL